MSTVVKLRYWLRRKASRYCFRRPLDVNHGFPLISFTFDDFPRTALLSGGSILADNGVRATYYVSLGLLDQEAPAGLICSAVDLQRAFQAGHELGCHTFDHCHSWDTSPSTFENSILKNRHGLAVLVPDARFRTLSYPIHCPRPHTKRRAAKFFDCCRGGGQTFNAGVTDLNNLSAYFLEQSGNDLGMVKRVIDANRTANGWLIIATHDVTENPSRFGCSQTFFEAVVRYAVENATVLTVSEALDRIQRQMPLHSRQANDPVRSAR